MDGKYPNNKKQNIRFLKDWLTRFSRENKFKIFCDDYHIDEIDPTITKKIWVESGLKMYEDYNHYLKTFSPQIGITLCIDLGEKKMKGKYPSLLDNNIVANSDTPHLFI